VVVPLTRAGAEDGVGRVPPPARDPVLRPGHADLGVALVPEADVEHHVPVALENDLAARNPVLLPGASRVGLENGIALVLGPPQPVLTGGVADGVGLALLAPGVPQAVQPRPVVVEDVRTHDGHFFPRLLGGEHGPVAQSPPRLAVRTAGTADPRP